MPVGSNLFALAVAGLVVALAGVAAMPSAAGTYGGTSASAAPSGAPPAPGTRPIQHVVVIYLENEGGPSVNKYGPYERYLAANYGNATDYFSACHASEPNYVAAVAAVTNVCGSDAYHNYTNTTLGDLISNDRAANLTWAQFAESLPSTICAHPGTNVGNFAFRHVPFLLFQNVTQNSTYCHDHVLGSAYFNGTLGSEGITTTHFVNFSFYSPNLCDDGHSVCGGSVPAVCSGLGTGKTACEEVTQADTWLRNFLDPQLNSTNPTVRSNVNHTLFLITYDEDGNPTTTAGYAVPGLTSGNNYVYCYQNGHTPGNAVCGGHVYAIVVDGYNRGVGHMVKKDSSYGIAATVEWLFDLRGANGVGLGNPGELDDRFLGTAPGFPTFAQISGITGNGYPAGN